MTIGGHDCAHDPLNHGLWSDDILLEPLIVLLSLVKIECFVPHHYHQLCFVDLIKFEKKKKSSKIHV